MINNDTLVAFTPKQVEGINVSKFKLNECLEIQDSLFKKIALDSTLITSQIALNKSLQSEINTQNDIIDNHKRINLELKKTIKRQQIKAGVFGGSALAFLVLLLVK